MLENTRLGKHEPRYRILWITPELMLEGLFKPQLLNGVLYGITAEGLPEGYQVQAVTYDFYRNAFGLRLYHESFDVVEECHKIPEIHVTFSRTEVRAAPVQRGREFI